MPAVYTIQMQKEHSMCNACTIRQTCHPTLRPEYYATNYELKDMPNRKTLIFLCELYFAYCRHFTCDFAGAEAARIELSSFSSGSDAYRVYDYENKEVEVSGRPFYSVDKPYKTRIIDENGAIYSEQDGRFYSTGQVIINSQ